MKLTEVKKVSIGSRIRYNGVDYQVISNLVDDLVLSPIGGSRACSLSALRKSTDYRTSEKTLVMVVEEKPATTGTSHRKGSVPIYSAPEPAVTKAEVTRALNLVRDEMVEVTSQLTKRVTVLEEENKQLKKQLLEESPMSHLTNDLQAQLNAKIQQKSTNKGGVNMKGLLNGFKGQFGKVTGKFAVSPFGLAISNGQGGYVVYDRANGSITDVSGLTLDFSVPAFQLPTEEKDVKVGAIVRNGLDYGYVTRVNDGYVEVVNAAKNQQGTVIPTTNALFKKAFYTVVQTLDVAQGNFNPMLLMAMQDGKKDDLLPFLLMSGGLGGDAAGGLDPMTLMLLKDSTDDLLPLILLQQGGFTGEGFNPLMFLLMDDDKGGKLGDLLPLMMMNQGGAGGIDPMMLMLLSDKKDGKKGKSSTSDLLPLMMMNQGGQGGQGINPMMLLAMDGDIDPMTLMMMGGMGGQNPFAAPEKAPVAPQAKDKK